MANSILGSIFSSSSFVVYNEATSYQIWSKLKIKDVEIGSESANADEPLSSQQATENTTYINLLTLDIQSSKIIRPSRLRITAFCDDVSILDSILSIFADPKATVSISSKSVITGSLALVSLGIKQNGDMLSASKLTMELEQALPPGSMSYNPSQSADASNYGVRVQTPSTLTQSVSTLYTSISTKLASIV